MSQKSPRDVRNSDFFKSILYRKSFMKYTKPKFKIGGRVRVSKIDIPFRKGYKPQFTDEIFEILAISSKKPPTTSSKISKKKFLGNFMRKS